MLCEIYQFILDHFDDTFKNVKYQALSAGYDESFIDLVVALIRAFGDPNLEPYYNDAVFQSLTKMEDLFLDGRGNGSLSQGS